VETQAKFVIELHDQTFSRCEPRFVVVGWSGAFAYN
jgi:hypothetical protein